ncbi:MAG: hypothetical protein L0Y71_22350 [Gemmataceae bacterium]|nr:hypothetical protein [Gemmataceae bacterium]
MNLILRFLLVGLTECLLPTISYSQGDSRLPEDSARREFAKLLKATDFPGVDSTLRRWMAELPSQTQRELVLLLIKNLTSDDKLRFETGVDETERLRKDLSTRGGRSGWVLRRMVGCPLPDLADPAADKTKLQQHAYEQVIRHMDLRHEPHPPLATMAVTERVKLAQDEKTSPVVLHHLFYDTNPEVRLAIAGNARATTTILMQLAFRDSDQRVREAAFKNLKRPRGLEDIEEHYRKKNKK